MNDQVNNVYATGKRVSLRPLTLLDAEGPWHTWFSNEETMKYVGYWRPNTVEKQKNFFRSRVEAGDDLVLAVTRNDTQQHIGVVSLSGINWIHRYADVALIIGDEASRKQAVFGLEAFSMILRIGFMRLNLENIKGGFIEGNEHSERILKAMRFNFVGRVNDLFLINNSRHDHVIVQLTRGEWLERN